MRRYLYCGGRRSLQTAADARLALSVTGGGEKEKEGIRRCVADSPPRSPCGFKSCAARVPLPTWRPAWRLPAYLRRWRRKRSRSLDGGGVGQGVEEARAGGRGGGAEPLQRLQFFVRPLIEAPFGNAQDALAQLRTATGFLDAAASFMWGADLLGLRGANHHPAHPLSTAAFAPDDGDDDPIADVRAALGMVPAARAAAEDAYMPLLSCRANLNSVCALVIYPGLPDGQGCVDRERGFAIAAFGEALRCTEICHTHISMASESLLGL